MLAIGLGNLAGQLLWRAGSGFVVGMLGVVVTMAGVYLLLAGTILRLRLKEEGATLLPHGKR